MNAHEEVLDAPAAAAAIAEYKPTEAALAELRQRYANVVWDCTTARGDKDARAARQELVKLRTSLEAKRKALKEPALEYSRRIDSEAKRITGEIVALEEPVDAAIKAEERRREAEKQARIEAEQRRIAAHQRHIESMRQNVVRCSGPGVAVTTIAEAIALVQAKDIGDNFEEFEQQARAAQEETLHQLRQLHAAAVEREAEAARLAAERAELERLRAEQAERERIERERLAAERRAEEDVTFRRKGATRFRHIGASRTEGGRTPSLQFKLGSFSLRLQGDRG